MENRWNRSRKGGSGKDAGSREKRGKDRSVSHGKNTYYKQIKVQHHGQFAKRRGGKRSERKVGRVKRGGDNATKHEKNPQIRLKKKSKCLWKPQKLPQQ